MIEPVAVDEPLGLTEYGAYADLTLAVQELRAEAALRGPALEGRTLWMVSSTPRGGGVAEMMPKLVSFLRELGVDARWLVAGSDRPEFFRLTKRIHNLIHGDGEPRFSAEDRELYEAVSRDNAAGLARLVRPGDVVVVHDPQPLGAGALLKRSVPVTAVWRCHIGFDERPATTAAAWSFLEPWARGYDHSVFSLPEYIPHFLAGHASVIAPGIDPLSHKNRHLTPHKLVGVLVNSGLAVEHGPVLTPAFEDRARRLSGDGTFREASEHPEIGLLFRPTVVQVSRWDRLKGFAPLLGAFARLKRGDLPLPEGSDINRDRHRRRLGILRLVLAGPDPGSVSDDPEAEAVLADLAERYLALGPELQRDVAVVNLPMASRKENALAVNALQRCATVVAQCSLREGFGLTVAEALWKRTPVLGSSACGVRRQVRDGLDGVLVGEASDPEEIAVALNALLADPHRRDFLARNGQRRVHDEFLVTGQLRRWLQVLTEAVPRDRVAP